MQILAENRLPSAPFASIYCISPSLCVIGDEVLLRSLITLVMVVMELGHMITPATTHYYHYQITRYPPPHPQPWEYATDIEEFTP